MALKCFVPTRPASGELSEYNRADVAFWFTQRPFTWEWGFSQNVPGPLGWPQARLIVDGFPATEWVQFTKQKQVFTLNTADGHHWIVAEIRDPNGIVWEVIEKGFVVNTSGTPLPMQEPWTARSRYDVNYDRIWRGHAQAVYNGIPPAGHGIPFKPRVIEPFNTRLTGDKLWTRRITRTNDRHMSRIFARIPTGDVVIEQDQKYFYYDAVSPNLASAIRLPPRVTLMDGQRGLGTLGYIYKLRLHPQGRGCYWTDTVGRMGFFSFPPDAGGAGGYVITIAGWRNKPGMLKAHSSTRETHPEFFRDCMEIVGDWSRVPDPKQFAEPWGFEAIPTPGMDGLHRFLVCDTLAHRIIDIDHLPAHEPAGQSILTIWLDRNSPGITSEMMDQPWDCTLNKAKTKIYWTNFGSGTICRANVDGTEPELIYRPAKNPHDALRLVDGQWEGALWGSYGWSPTDNLLSIVVNQRMANSVIKAPGQSGVPTPSVYIRPMTADGPFGVSNHFRPQACEFVIKNGQEVLRVAHRYEYHLVDYDFEAQTSEVFAVIPKVDQWQVTDIAMAISDGTYGPEGDTFIDAWNASKHRWAADGTYLKSWSPTTNHVNGIVTGPGNNSAPTGYSWGLVVGQGRLVTVGNAGGWQFLEVTKRQPTDPVPDLERIQRAFKAGTHGHEPPMALLFGPYLDNQLGLPTVDEMGAWPDDRLRAFGMEHGIPQAVIEDWLYWVRFMTVDNDYTVVEPPPPPPMDDMEFVVDGHLFEVRDLGPTELPEDTSLRLHEQVFTVTPTTGE